MFPPQVSCHPIGPALLYCWHTVDNVGPTVNQRWAGVSCLLRGEVFSHLMLFDIIFYHRCRCEIPHLKNGVYNRGVFGWLLFSSTEHNSIRKNKLRGKSMRALPLWTKNKDIDAWRYNELQWFYLIFIADAYITANNVTNVGAYLIYYINNINLYRRIIIYYKPICTVTNIQTWISLPFEKHCLVNCVFML